MDELKEDPAYVAHSPAVVALVRAARAVSNWETVPSDDVWTHLHDALASFKHILRRSR